MNSYKIGSIPLSWVAALILLLGAVEGFAASRLSAGLAVNPTGINFGSISVGTSLLQNVVMLNVGTASVTISSATMSGPGFQVTGLTLPMTLAPGQSSAFQVTFMPSSAGSVTGYVYLRKNNGTVLAKVSLSGTGMATAIAQTVPHSA